MQKRLLLVFLYVIFSMATFAAYRIDSIGVENSNGKQIILHKVEAKENYYSLARRYNVSPKDIIDYNNNQTLQIGTVLKIPTSRPFSTKTVSAKEKKDIIDYKVGPKEGLYAIARKFNTTVEDIKRLNNLNTDALSIGQIIKIRKTGTIPVNASEPTKPEPTTTETVIPQVDTSRIEDPKIKGNKYGLREVAERGVAIWIADENLDGTKMLVLHRSAPIGTIIKITNPMTEKSTFAKVVGKFTENETTKDVIIVVTKATADLLGALDKRFQVSLVYGIPNE